MRLFFIVGRGRSGTTLLARLLTQHRELAVAPEGMFALHLRRAYGRGLRSAAERERFGSELERERRMRTWHLRPDAVQARLRALGPDAGYAEACRAVYQSYAHDTLGRTQVRMVGDKNPHHALFAGALARMFPEAKLVHITRDLRDNVASYRRAPFDLSHAGALAYRWRRYNQVLLRLSAEEPGRVLRLRYEDLIAQPEHALRRVCEHLGVAYDPSMLQARSEQPRLRPGEAPGWYQQPIAELERDRVARFERELSVAALAQVEAIAGGMAARLGYAARSPAAHASAVSIASGWALGWCSVQAEKLLFEHAPAWLRFALINGYRSGAGRNA